MCQSLVKDGWRTNNDFAARLDIFPRCFCPQVQLRVITMKNCGTFNEVVSQDSSLLLHKRNTKVVSTSIRTGKLPTC